MDPERDYSEFHNACVKTFFIAVSIGTGVMFIIFMSIHVIYSSFLLIIYMITLLVYVWVIPPIRDQIFISCFFSVVLVTITTIVIIINK